MTKPQQFDASKLVHTPAQMLQGLVEWAERTATDPGIKFGIPAIDKVAIPLRPGNLACFIARPGHAKTSLLVYLARQEALRILADGDPVHEAVIYTTWEQTAEELTAMLLADPEITYSDIAWGRADVERIRERASSGIKPPVWIIGHGISKSGLNIPRMTPDLVLSAIETMERDHGVKPRMILFDYLQLIPTRTSKDRVQQVTEMPILIKELALRVGVPALAAVQAGRDVDQRRPPIPEMADAQWGSSIEQTADRIFSLWRPSRTMELNSKVDMGDRLYTVTENLLVIRLLKQRGDIGRHTWAMYFDPAYLKLAEMEKRYDDNGRRSEPTDYLHR